MSLSKLASGTTSKPASKTKAHKKVLAERTGELWTLDPEGGLQILDGSDETATAVDYFGLFWGVKAGPKKLNSKNMAVCAHRRVARHACT